MLRSTSPQSHLLLSLPPAAAEYFAASDDPFFADTFIAADPPGGALGSGGGTAHLLAEAWQAEGEGRPFGEWLQAHPRLVVHGGGQSRRLPAYAPSGKPLIPLPAERAAIGGRDDLRLFDLQRHNYMRVVDAAAPQTVLLIATGDVILEPGSVPPLPRADVVALGVSGSAEAASRFGAFFTRSSAPDQLVLFRQKPSLDESRGLGDRGLEMLIDSGIWLLSARAVDVLMRKCGWSIAAERFADASARPFEFYAGFALALGSEPAEQDREIAALSSAIVRLPDARFLHLGSSREMIEAIAIWSADGRAADGERSSRITFHSAVDDGVLAGAGGSLWIENSTITPGWRLSSDHVLTGVPENRWEISLDPGICLDFVPVASRDFALRHYHIDDSFRGEVGAGDTMWMGGGLSRWLAAREIELGEAGLDPSLDIHEAPIFPVISPEAIDSRFLEWLVSPHPAADPALGRLWRSLPRLSAEGLRQRMRIDRLLEQRTGHQARELQRLYGKPEFFKRDLDRSARLFAASELPLPLAPDVPTEPLESINDHMWRSAVLRYRDDVEWETAEASAFAALRRALSNNVAGIETRPTASLQEDQIVTASAPLRFDLAGGWTDTPPYCIVHGGTVTNVAVDLNGAPPVQVIVRPTVSREIVLRSLDLGTEERITEAIELQGYADPGATFGLAKAALVLAGLVPDPLASESLDERLEEFGGGLDITLFAAVPRGSGLGTSSILAATLLGALSETCGLGWSRDQLVERTLVLEQLLTTGGGWQDQAGGIYRGAKKLTSAPGLEQTVGVEELPSTLFGEHYANRTILLYYTGITRLAKGILQEIVRGMFLNEADRLELLAEIGENGREAADALRAGDWNRLCASIARSWQLNRRLDPGTDPPAVRSIIEPVENHLAATKLLGAGGGGYLLMFAKDESAAGRIRERLEQFPQNRRARFVNFAVSTTGLRVARS